jgi:hypothetical protein
MSNCAITITAVLVVATMHLLYFSPVWLESWRENFRFSSKTTTQRQADSRHRQADKQTNRQIEADKQHLSQISDQHNSSA